MRRVLDSLTLRGSLHTHAQNCGRVGNSDVPSHSRGEWEGAHVRNAISDIRCCQFRAYVNPPYYHGTSGSGATVTPKLNTRHVTVTESV